jgi:hypothetical protein
VQRLQDGDGWPIRNWWRARAVGEATHKDSAGNGLGDPGNGQQRGQQ